MRSRLSVYGRRERSSALEYCLGPRRSLDRVRNESLPRRRRVGRDHNRHTHPNQPHTLSQPAGPRNRNYYSTARGRVHPIPMSVTVLFLPHTHSHTHTHPKWINDTTASTNTHYVCWLSLLVCVPLGCFRVRSFGEALSERYSREDGSTRSSRVPHALKPSQRLPVDTAGTCTQAVRDVTT